MRVFFYSVMWFIDYFFRKYIVVMSLWKNWCINPRRIWLQHETFFWEWLTILCIACIEQENNFDYDFTEDVNNFLMSNFLSTFDNPFSGVSKILINDKWCRWVSCQVEVLLFLNFLLPKLTIILFIWSWELLFLIWGINVFTNLIHMWWQFLVVENKK